MNGTSPPSPDRAINGDDPSEEGGTRGDEDTAFYEHTHSHKAAETAGHGARNHIFRIFLSACLNPSSLAML